MPSSARCGRDRAGTRFAWAPAPRANGVRATARDRRRTERVAWRSGAAALDDLAHGRLRRSAQHGAARPVDDHELDLACFGLLVHAHQLDESIGPERVDKKA